MHIRTQLRTAVKDRLVAAGVAGGRVFTHDPRIVGETALPLVVIEPEIENGIEVKGPRSFAPRALDRKTVGRLQIRKVRFSATAYADTLGPKDADGNFTAIDKDADEAADDLSEAIEAALFDGANRLMTKDSGGNAVRLGERDLQLLGTGGVRNPETGARQVGVVHHLFEALLLTDEGDPSTVINR